MAAIFIFNHAAWEDMYVRNCSYLTAQEWLAEGPPNIPIGVLYMTFGVVCEVLGCSESSETFCMNFGLENFFLKTTPIVVMRGINCAHSQNVKCLLDPDSGIGVSILKRK